LTLGAPNIRLGAPVLLLDLRIEVHLGERIRMESVGLAQVRRDLAQMRRAQRVTLALRILGHITRPVVFLGPLVVLLWGLWVGIGSQPITDLTVGDLFLVFGCVVGFFGFSIPAVLFLANVDGGDIDWEAWGRAGLGILPAAVLGALWLII